MKPAPFRYVRAESLDHVLGVLAEHGDEAKVIAGGQSLLPLMSMRLVEPSIVVDIGPLSGLGTIGPVDDGVDAGAQIGALVTHRRVETWGAAGPLAQLMRDAASHVGHLPIRVRGTFGGSLAHADPASEWGLVAVLCGARVLLASQRGGRVVPADEFLVGFLTTGMEDDELLTGVEVPSLPDEAGVGFAEYCRRAGDFATALAGSVVAASEGRIGHARLAIGGGTSAPTRVPAAEAMLTGAPIGEPAAVEAAAEQAGRSLECHPTPGVSVTTRRRVATACARRAIRQAVERAAAHQGGAP